MPPPVHPVYPGSWEENKFDYQNPVVGGDTGGWDAYQADYFMPILTNHSRLDHESDEEVYALEYPVHNISKKVRQQPFLFGRAKKGWQ